MPRKPGAKPWTAATMAQPETGNPQPWVAHVELETRVAVAR
jgi:hypothetical protein